MTMVVELAHVLPAPRRATYLVHEDVKDARGDGQGEEGEEEGEEPGGGVHGGVETLGAEVDVELRKLLLQGRRRRRRKRRRR